MKIAKIRTEEELFARMNHLRGLLALVVLLSHIWGYTGISVLVPFNKVVTIAVTFFFFFSGYGMIQSYEKKKYYLKEIFCVKIPFLLWMAVLAYVFSVALECLFREYGAVGYLPAGIRNFLYSTNWYVYELTGCYLLFAAVKKWLKNRKVQLFSVACVSIVAFVVLYNSGVVEAYYNSIIGFGLGMFCAEYHCFGFMNKQRGGAIAAALLTALTFGAMLVLDRTSMLAAIDRNIAAAACIFLVLYIICYVDLDNAVNLYLSRISPEIYFYHMPIALIFSMVIENVYLYTTAVVVVTMLVSPLFSLLNRQVQRRIKSLYTL